MNRVSVLVLAMAFVILANSVSSVCLLGVCVLDKDGLFYLESTSSQAAGGNIRYFDCTAGKLPTGKNSVCRDDCSKLNTQSTAYSCTPSCKCAGTPVVKNVTCSSGSWKSGDICLDNCQQAYGSNYHCTSNCSCAYTPPPINNTSVNCSSGSWKSGDICIDNCLQTYGNYYYCNSNCNCAYSPPGNGTNYTSPQSLSIQASSRPGTSCDWSGWKQISSSTYTETNELGQTRTCTTTTSGFCAKVKGKNTITNTTTSTTCGDWSPLPPAKNETKNVTCSSGSWKSGDICLDNCQQAYGSNYHCTSNCSCAYTPPPINNTSVNCSSGSWKSGDICIDNCLQTYGNYYYCNSNCNCAYSPPGNGTNNSQFVAINIQPLSLTVGASGTLSFTITNLGQTTIAAGTATAVLGGSTKQFAIPSLGAGQSYTEDQTVSCLTTQQTTVVVSYLGVEDASYVYCGANTPPLIAGSLYDEKILATVMATLGR